MTKVVQSLVYQPTSSENQKGVTSVTVDGVLDTSWLIKIAGNVQGTPRNVVPKFLTVDNIANNANIVVRLGAFIYTVPPYNREVFSIPTGLDAVAFTLPSASVSFLATLSEEQLAGNNQNQLLTQQTAAATLVYTYQTYTAFPANQQLTDLNKTVQFVKPGAGTGAYNLLSIASGISNGWIQFIRNDSTVAADIQIVPSGADTINGVFDAAHPLVLKPGDSGILSSSGTQWYFSGNISFESAEVAITAAALNTLAHGLGKKPNSVIEVLRCKTAEINWSAGDELIVSHNIYFNSANTVHGDAVWFDATNLYIRQDGSNSLAPGDKNTGGHTVNLTPANWRKVFYAQAHW